MEMFIGTKALTESCSVKKVFSGEIAQPQLKKELLCLNHRHAKSGVLLKICLSAWDIEVIWIII